MDRITRQLASFAAGLGFADLPREVMTAAKQRLLDATGCAIASYDCGPARAGRALATGSRPGKYPGRVLIWNDEMPVQDAAFVNTSMIRDQDFNDRYPGGHPSDCLGALLAIAGGRHISGQRCLAGMVIAYETFARLNDATQMTQRGWDQGFAAAVATAASASALLELTFEQTAEAIAIAAVSNVPLRATRSGELTTWKNAATAFAVRDGLFAALLASEGIEGPSHAFEGRHGLFDQVTGAFELEPFPTEGGRFVVPEVMIKYWPVESNAQAVVWAALQLRELMSIDSIERLDVETSDFAYHEIASEPEKWDPRTRETADHSLPYIFARAMVDGTIGPASFDEEQVRDPDLRPFMSRIRVAVVPEIEAALPEVILRVRAASGDSARRLEIVNPIGHPANPMSNGDIRDKFNRSASPVLGLERCAAIVERWSRFDEDEDVGLALDLLALDP